MSHAYIMVSARGRFYVEITYSGNAPPLRVIFVNAISQVTVVVPWRQRRCEWLSIEIIRAKNLGRFTGCAVRKLAQVVIETILVVHLGRTKSVSASPDTAEWSFLKVAEPSSRRRCYSTATKSNESEAISTDAARWQSENKPKDIGTAGRCRRPNFRLDSPPRMNSGS